MDVGGMRLEMPTQCLINHVLENECIIDGIVLGDVWHLVPTGLSPTGDAGIHNVVGDEEDGLEPFDHPSEYGRILVFRGGEFALFEYLDALNYRETTGHFPTGNGVWKTCGVVVDELMFEIWGEGRERLERGEEFRFDLLVNGEEGFLARRHDGIDGSDWLAS